MFKSVTSFFLQASYVNSTSVSGMSMFSLRPFLKGKMLSFGFSTNQSWLDK